MEKKCKVWNAFLEDYNDDELQLRYDRFVSNSKKTKEAYNRLVPSINETIDELSNIDELIFKSALINVINEVFLERRKILQKEIEDTTVEMQRLETSFKEDEKLAKDYKETAEHRLFVWYKALKSVAHPEVKSYIEFKNKWGNRII